MEDKDDDAVNVTGKSIVDDEIDCYLKNQARKSILIRFAFGMKTLKLIQEFQKLLKKFYPSLLPQQLLKKIVQENISSGMMLFW